MDSLVEKSIKQKLYASGGKATIPLLNGGLCEIDFDPTIKEGILSPKGPPVNQLIWETFDAAIEVEYIRISFDKE
jgi:hypothetical protein